MQDEKQIRNDVEEKQKDDKKLKCRNCEEQRKISQEYKELMRITQHHLSKTLSFVSALVLQLSVNSKQLNIAIEERASLKIKEESLGEEARNLELKSRRIGLRDE